MQIHINLDTTIPSDLKALVALVAALSNGQLTQSTSGSNQPVTVARLETSNEQSASSSVTTESQQQPTESGTTSSTSATDKPKSTRSRKPKADETHGSGGESEPVGETPTETTEAATEGTEPDAGATETGAQEAPADEAAADQKALTLEFLRAQFTAKARADKTKVGQIRELLKEFGVADLSGLAKDKYNEIFARLEAI